MPSESGPGFPTVASRGSGVCGKLFESFSSVPYQQLPACRPVAAFGTALASVRSFTSAVREQPIILGELRASVPAEITVFSTNPPDTLARHRVLANAADFVVERFGAEVVFVPMEKFDMEGTGLVEDLDMDGPPLESIGIGKLCGRIDHKWDTRETIRAKLGERLPGLRRRARLTNEALLRLLGTIERRLSPALRARS